MGKTSESSRLISDRELRLTAVVYARLGVVPYLRTHGRLPDRIGGPWNLIPMRLVIEERGTDPELTDDERLVYQAILREGRLPGGRWFCWMKKKSDAKRKRSNFAEKSNDDSAMLMFFPYFVPHFHNPQTQRSLIAGTLPDDCRRLGCFKHDKLEADHDPL